MLDSKKKKVDQNFIYFKLNLKKQIFLTILDKLQ